jgi:L-fuconolactonase
VTVVDAHQHYWRAGAQRHAWRGAAHAVLERDFEPADLRGELRAAGVDATVLVQSADEPAENDRLAAYARATPSVAGVIAWLPVHEPAAARRELDRLASLPKLAGVRRLVSRDPLDWLDRADVIDLFGELAERRLAWDVVAVTPAQRAAVCRLAQAVPGLRIVLDHLARAPLEGGDWADWEADLRALARCPAVALKLSVGIDALTAWERWDARALARAVGIAVDAFGLERLMLASNWPVVLLRCPYARAWCDLAAAAGGDRAALGVTAARWYGLATPALRRSRDRTGEARRAAP